MERQERRYHIWKSAEELGFGPDAEKAIAESIRAKVRRWLDDAARRPHTHAPCTEVVLERVALNQSQEHR